MQEILYSFNYVLIYMLILLKNYTFYIEHRTITNLLPPTYTFKVYRSIGSGLPALPPQHALRTGIAITHTSLQCYTVFSMFPFKPL